MLRHGIARRIARATATQVQAVNDAVCVIEQTTFWLADILAAYPPGRTLAAGVAVPAAMSASSG